MNYKLENENIVIQVSDIGGELKSFYDKRDQKEYLWQGDEKYWEDSSPNLFPYIARLTDGTYSYKGKQYHLSIHGFIKDLTLSSRMERGALIFETRADEITMQNYPFLFHYRIRYQLDSDTVNITYEIDNNDEKEMFFGVGGHPGFQVPFIENTNFDDYYIEFEDAADPVQIQMSKDCFVIGEMPFTQGIKGKLKLTHSLFDNDAIILKNMGKSVLLKSVKSNKGILVRFPMMNYLGIWHKPRTDAPYVCIEPWTSLPSRKGIVEDIEKQENLICLPAKKTYKNKWTITLHHGN